MTPLSRRHVVRAAALAVLAAVGVSVVGGARRFLAGREEGARLRRRVAEAEAAVARKRSLLALSGRDDDMLETEARRQLGLIGEGEVEFRFVPSPDGGPDRMDAVQAQP